MNSPLPPAPDSVCQLTGVLDAGFRDLATDRSEGAGDTADFRRSRDSPLQRLLESHRRFESYRHEASRQAASPQYQTAAAEAQREVAAAVGTGRTVRLALAGGSEVALPLGEGEGLKLYATLCRTLSEDMDPDEPIRLPDWCGQLAAEQVGKWLEHEWFMRHPELHAPRARFQDHHAGIRKVLEQVHSHLQIDAGALALVQSGVDALLRSILQGQPKNLGDAQDAVQTCLPGELARHADFEGTKAISSESSYGSVQDDCPMLEQDAAGYVAGVLEYIAAELLELAGNACRDVKSETITTADVKYAINNDEELAQLPSSAGESWRAAFLAGVADDIPLLCSTLHLAGHLGVDELHAALAVIAQALDEKTAALTWVQLQLCDGKHLMRANQGLSAEEEQELAAMPTSFWLATSWMPDVHDAVSDPVAERRLQLEAKRDARCQADTDACLGLFGWADAERERRQALTNAAVAANKAARATVGLIGELTDDEGNELEEKSAPALIVLDGWLADAVVAGDLSTAKMAFAKGAALDLHRVDSMTEIPSGVSWLANDALKTAENQDGIIYAMDNGDALPLICSVANNIPMINWLLDNGADVNLTQPTNLNVKDFGCFGGRNVLGSAINQGLSAEEEQELAAMPPKPMKKRALAEDMPAYVWAHVLEGLDEHMHEDARGLQLDVHDAANDPVAERRLQLESMRDARLHPRRPVGREFPAVELLCARGANPNCTFIPARRDLKARFLREGDMQSMAQRNYVTAYTDDDPIARCLVRHGADVNAIYRPDGDYDPASKFGSYWKNVVEAGDVAWAAELLAKYNANADWPSDSNIHEGSREDDCYGFQNYYADGDRGDDFSTVLIVAVRKQDLPMVRLLLDHGADVNKAKPKFTDGAAAFEVDQSGELPLSVALKTGNAPIIELLQSKGAKAAE